MGWATKGFLCSPKALTQPPIQQVVAYFCVVKLEGREAELSSHIYFTGNRKCRNITSVCSSV